MLLNVENPLWEKELDQFQVRGIPTVLFYGPDGSVRGRSVGLRQPEQLEAMAAALLRDDLLPFLNHQGATSTVTDANPGQGSTFEVIQWRTSWIHLLLAHGSPRGL